MIDLTRLIRGLDNRPEQIRYENRRASDALVPLVVWNTTPACNLRCKHCYFGACDERDSEELSTAEAKAFIDSLAAVNVPVLVFSGGEPFFRDDIAELTRHASERGIRPIASSNGTFLTEERAEAVADAGMQYVASRWTASGRPTTSSAASTGPSNGPATGFATPATPGWEPASGVR